jgi:hypothetical protein
MIRILGRFNEDPIVLNQPPPPELKPNTVVEIVIPDEREQTLREMLDFWNDWWSRPLPDSGQLTGRHWSREELYERGGRPLS